MASDEGGDGLHRPRLRFDHVQVAVADLEEAAARFTREHGLVALPGGRHPGRGTGNLIVPLGDSYLELIAVVDRHEAAAFPSSQRVARAVESGRTFAVWAARTTDLEATRRSLLERGLELPDPAPGSRRRPDGVQLAWRVQELVSGGQFSALPFLIEWQVPVELFPGSASARHPSGARGVVSLRLADPDPKTAEERLRLILADDLEYSIEEGLPGMVEMTLDTPSGPITLK